MSMLSAQVDRLRELATRCNELQAGAVRAVTMPSDMGSILREAADTIWQLRDDLQRANAENAKLRELVKRMHRHIRQTCGECDGWYCSNFDEDNECCVYDTLARELGVEVSDGD